MGVWDTQRKHHLGGFPFSGGTCGSRSAGGTSGRCGVDVRAHQHGRALLGADAHDVAGMPRRNLSWDLRCASHIARLTKYGDLIIFLVPGFSKLGDSQNPGW